MIELEGSHRKNNDCLAVFSDCRFLSSPSMISQPFLSRNLQSISLSAWMDLALV